MGSRSRKRERAGAKPPARPDDEVSPAPTAETTGGPADAATPPAATPASPADAATPPAAAAAGPAGAATPPAATPASRADTAAPPAAAGARAPATPAGTAPAADTPARMSPASDEVDPLRRRYARGRARDEAVREGLEPLAPGVRPRAVTVAAIVAFAFAAANVAAALTGNDLSTSAGNASAATAVTTAVLLLAGIGMLLRQYWAVLGFQTILALQIIFFSLALLRVQKWWLGILMVIAICLLGMMFWKLVRAMARLQMPDRGGATR
ncbi:MAG: hypothetical protein QOG94_823 [Solirubrobacteraceae bacterium]|nr:hypothetical protein [Solirubrobacteraceae bacterium]